MARNVTPAVAKAAAAYAIDLDGVAATGAGGRVTLGDVRAAAGLLRDPKDERRAAAAIAGPMRVEVFAARSGSDSGPRGRNPLVAKARAEDPGRFARAMSSTAAPAPTLFASGDVPPFCASGVDPQALLELPWQARHPVAEAATQEAAFSIMQECSGAEGAGWAEFAFGGHEGNLAYAKRVKSWAVASATDGEIWEALGGPEREAKAEERIALVNEHQGPGRAVNEGSAWGF